MPGAWIVRCTATPRRTTIGLNRRRSCERKRRSCSAAHTGSFAAVFLSLSTFAFQYFVTLPAERLRADANKGANQECRDDLMFERSEVAKWEKLHLEHLASHGIE